MGIFNFLKKIFEDEKSDNLGAVKPEEIVFDKLDSRIEQGLKEIIIKKESLNKAILQEVNELDLRLGEEMTALKKVNIDERRETEKLKSIVSQNLKQYIYYLEKLRKDIREAENSNSEIYAKTIYSIFLNFEKTSNLSMQKATILIGKEFEEIRASINNFLKNYNKIISESQKEFNNEPLLIEIKNLLKEIAEINNIKIKIEENLANLSKIGLEFNNLLIKKSKEFDNLKSGSEYKLDLQIKEKQKQGRIILNQEILDFKQKIDLKSLIKHFHDDKNKSRLLVAYNDNFIEALNQDVSLEILGLIKIVKSELLVEEVLKNIKLKNEELGVDSETKIQFEIKTLEKELFSLNNKIRENMEESDKEKKKIEKFNERTLEIMGEVRNKAKNVGWNIL